MVVANVIGDGEPGIPKVLTSTELHAHLYGCIRAENLWEWGRDIAAARSPRLEWYVHEYQKLAGHSPNWQAYWQSPTGLAKLRQDFEMDRQGSFARFQAGFNLAIALFPLDPQDTSFFKKILHQEYEQGTRLGEYRIVIPPHFKKHEIFTYVASIARTLEQIASDGAWQPKIILSLSRDPGLFQEQIQTLRAALGALLPEGSTHLIPGVDLCGVEEGHPPREIAAQLTEVHRGNLQDPAHALKIFYHVGESFTDKSLFSAIRWVHEAAELGVHRLGHALALGVHPTVHLDERRPEMLRVCETAWERRDHLHWLLQYGPQLKEFGYNASPEQIRHELATLSCLAPAQVVKVPEASLPFDERVAEAALLQKAVMSMIARKQTPIEVCPTSNLRIGQIPSWSEHPLSCFLNYNAVPEHDPLQLVICSDDPGIFSQSLAQEWQTLVREFPAIRGQLPHMVAWLRAQS